MFTSPGPLEEGSDELGVVWPIAILHWPEDAAQNAALAQQRRPRLLLVAPEAEAPVDFDGLTDWVRRPATAKEIYARVEALQRRTEWQSHLYMDADGLVRRGRRWVALSPVESRLMGAFLARPGAVLSPGELVAAGWPHGRSRDRALHPRQRRRDFRIDADRVVRIAARLDEGAHRVGVLRLA